MTRLMLTASLIGIAMTSGPLWAHSDARSGDSWSFGRPGLAKDVSRTVQIEADEYTFVPAQLSVKAGETVRFVVTNRGKLKHELTIGDAAEQKAHQESMSRMSDMKHDEGNHEMPANSVHVLPGKTQELIWTFSKSGALTIACNYPGHSELGMTGELEVRQAP
jgi:uncharacterized cupredoxin-like copper-binding protein